MNQIQRIGPRHYLAYDGTTTKVHLFDSDDHEQAKPLLTFFGPDLEVLEGDKEVAKVSCSAGDWVTLKTDLPFEVKPVDTTLPLWMFTLEADFCFAWLKYKKDID